MTWRELFRRAWLVPRLRFKTFRVCLECGDLLDEWHPQPGYTQYFCPACKEWEELEREKTQHEFLAGLPSGPTIGEVMVQDRLYYLAQMQALQNASRPLDPALLQNQIGAPIRYLGDLHDVFEGAIGSAIDASGLRGIFS